MLAGFDPMRSKLSTLDLQDQLVVYSTKQPSTREATLSAAAAGAVVAYMIYQQFGGAAAAGAALVTGVSIAMITFRAEATATHAELKVNRQEMVLETRSGNSVQTPQRTLCFDIQWLEYRPGEAPSRHERSREGLYAVMRDGNVCILPGVDEREAETVKERIGDKFPELREQWERRSPFGAEYSGSA
jgi:hypothetical protein